jgi:hypothetical protein
VEYEHIQYETEHVFLFDRRSYSSCVRYRLASDLSGAFLLTSLACLFASLWVGSILVGVVFLTGYLIVAGSLVCIVAKIGTHRTIIIESKTLVSKEQATNGISIWHTLCSFLVQNQRIKLKRRNINAIVLGTPTRNLDFEGIANVDCRCWGVGVFALTHRWGIKSYKRIVDGYDQSTARSFGNRLSQILGVPLEDCTGSKTRPLDDEYDKAKEGNATPTTSGSYAEFV